MNERLWMWYQVALVAMLIVSAMFLATSDGWVRLDGWLAIANAVGAVFSWYRIKEGNRNG